ncbi:MAG: DUF11 domain-containing protein [Planctomycetaceae bacterium]|nr:DUF11 domain-containing protein [Planctomycetales bacterium]MCB9921437.1 DUF11 domain-containing protein [Planctomycetaceae bacterium]
MKRLWMRLGLVAGILGVGGAGVLVAQKGGQSPEEKTVATSAGEDTPEEKDHPRPIPLAQSSYETGEMSSSSPVSNEDRYSNELDPVEPPSSARFVDSSSSARYASPQYLDTDTSDAPSPPSQYSAPQYSNSPASYSIHDDEAESSPAIGQHVEESSQQSYAPSSSYVADYATDAPPTASTYASRYGNSDSVEPSAGSSLRSPQELPESGNRYGSYGQTGTDENMTTTTPIAEVKTPPLDAIPDSPSNLQEPAPVVANDATIEPPPMRTAQSPASSGYAPVQVDTALPSIQPQVSARSSIGDPPADASASVAAVVASPLASDTPGGRDLEGTQTPTLTLEKRAPGEVSVGQAAPFKILVRNVGDVTAHGVVVTDRVPQGTKLVDASPDFTQTSDGAIAWQLGDLEPGDQAQVSIELMPLVEGEIGSVAQVSFQAQASVRTVSTKPELVVKHTGPDRVLIGEDVVFDITLSNPGSGATTGIIIEEDVPPGLVHVAGEKLEYEIGTLRPKEEKRLQLVLRANKAGIVNNVLRVKADAGLVDSDQLELEVLAPELQVAIGGPRTRYLERQATYEVAIANPGTSTAYDIQLVTFLPKGLKYVSADNKGAYDPQRHAVYWSLAELPAQESGSVKLTALPIETGEQKLRVEGTANLNLSAKFEHTTNVEGLTELAFSVQDVHDPIEVGSETTYEIRIANNGNKVATNVQIAAVLPPQLIPLKGEGPTKVVVEGQQVFMEPLARIAARDEAVYRITAKGIAAGDHVIVVQLSSDEAPTPVRKEEGTKVYSDE